VLVTGPGGTNLYNKGLLDKLGVTANVYRVGAYKAAVEPSPEATCRPNRARRTRRFAAALWENWQQDVQRAAEGAARGLCLQRP
jgi:protease-4